MPAKNRKKTKISTHSAQELARAVESGELSEVTDNGET